MRKFFAVVAAVVAAMSRTTAKWVKRAGKWVLEMPLPGAGAGPVPMPVQSAIDDDIRGDEDELACIRSVAAQIAASKIPDPKLMQRVGDMQMRWLCQLKDEQLKSITRASNADLRGHLAGRKNLRGVLVYDAATIEALERAQEPIDATIEPEYVLPAARFAA